MIQAEYDEIAKRDQSGLDRWRNHKPHTYPKNGRDPVEVIRQLSQDFPHFESISAEVVADNALDMIKQISSLQRDEECDHQSPMYS